ncbi:MAG: murein biosynthesis integral membrane protein MurJ [Chloroflexota bacterium]
MTIPSPVPVSANRQIARAAGTVMAAILLGQLAGLLRGIVVARAFPADLLDAFLVANRVSETLFNLIAGGALGSAFIPTFTGFLAKNDRDSAWRLASGVANLLTLTLSLLAVIAAWFAPQIIRYALAPGLFYNFGLFNLTIDLMRIQLVSAVLFGLGGLVVGILNAHQVFLVPALTPSMYQIGLIFGALALSRRMGIYGLAWGAVIGAGLYLAVQIPSLVKVAARAGSSYTPALGLNDPNVLEVIRLMGPRLLGVAVVQVNFWVNNWLASQMAEGSVTGLYYGFALMLMAQAAIAQSVAIAAMPTFSAQFALGKMDEMRNALATALRGMLLLAIPASVGLVLLRQPLVAMLYERGEFTPETTQLVAWALLWYAIGLVGHSVMEVLTRAFYAQHDTKTPVLVGTVAMGLNVVFSFGFSAWFEQIGWMPHGGLALANSLATALEAAALFALMRRRLKGIDGEIIATGFGKSAMAALGMALALMVWMQAGASPNRWVEGLGGVAVGGLVYSLSVWVLKVPEIEMVMGALKRRLGK